MHCTILLAFSLSLLAPADDLLFLMAGQCREMLIFDVQSHHACLSFFRTWSLHTILVLRHAHVSKYTMFLCHGLCVFENTFLIPLVHVI
jgi:hypothetical protein